MWFIHFFSQRQLWRSGRLTSCHVTAVTVVGHAEGAGTAVTFTCCCCPADREQQSKQRRHTGLQLLLHHPHLLYHLLYHLLLLLHTLSLSFIEKQQIKLQCEVIKK